MGFVLRWLTTSVPGDSTPDLSYLRTAYFALQLGGGHIGLPLLILIFVSSRRVYRPASVINFCSTWVVYSVSYSLLLYTDRRPPSFTLCLAQSAMIHGAPPMAVVAGLGVVLQVYSTFQLPWQCRCLAPLSRLPRWILVLLIVTPPYLVFAVFATSAAFTGLKDPPSLSFENRLYCSIKPKASPFNQFAVPVFCTVILGTIIAVETTMIVQYCRRWLHVKHAFPLVNRRPSLSPLLRFRWSRLSFLALKGATYRIRARRRLVSIWKLRGISTAIRAHDID
ncbi:hypothetical protein PHLGIDRAFT_155474 [Phlebiopsis gigantea 11061_1 CR5-6]|uniref:Uncharacterized protein n=1 Tax=Phlebiopsis gigantea (strain 11061_1 CR5-6) TaxID=745531 RepID=A0A0C3NK66_PHLG1|nr:hypothetical protein PHLGIDRAFT_155474 [Phlebiopsis gigantea 11061_1 CR5-6]